MGLLYILSALLLVVIYLFAVIAAIKAGSTTAFIVLIFIMLLALLVTATFVLLILLQDFFQDLAERKKKTYLERNTASVVIRTVEGVIVERYRHKGRFYVIVRIGQKTDFKTEDEDAFFASYSETKIRVKFREHRDSRNKIIHREIIRIIL